MSNSSLDEMSPADRTALEHQHSFKDLMNTMEKTNKRSFTGLTCVEIKNSRETQMIVIAKNGKTLSFFTYPALKTSVQSVARVMGSECLGTHIRTCRAMFMSKMPSMITKKEAYCMEYFRKPLKRLTEADLATSFEGV